MKTKEVIPVGDAKLRGLKFYFTGRRCRKGHLADRYVSTRECVVCRSLTLKRNRLPNAKRVVRYPLEIEKLRWESTKKEPPINTPLLLKVATRSRVFPFEYISDAYLWWICFTGA